MQILTMLLTAAALFSSSDPVLVQSVIDGDTISVAAIGRVRLLGIDAPEVAHGLATAAPFGQKAKDFLTGLVLHRWVRLETDGESVDIYNRRLAYVVTEDGQFVNALIVGEGLARVSARTPISRLDDLKRAEAEAQALRKGIWSTATPFPSAGYTRPSKKRVGRAGTTTRDTTTGKTRGR